MKGVKDLWMLKATIDTPWRSKRSDMKTGPDTGRLGRDGRRRRVAPDSQVRKAGLRAIGESHDAPSRIVRRPGSIRSVTDSQALAVIALDGRDPMRRIGFEGQPKPGGNVEDLELGNSQRVQCPLRECLATRYPDKKRGRRGEDQTCG